MVRLCRRLRAPPGARSLGVAPAGVLPEAHARAAVLSGGEQGVERAPGTWHHALLAAKAVKAVEVGDFVRIERAGATAGGDLHALAEPVLLEPALA